MKERLTNQKYWNSIWSKSNNYKNREIAKNEIFENDLIKRLSSIEKQGDKSIVELGASGNGQFMYIFDKHFPKSKISALDFDESSLEQTYKLCKENNVNITTIHDDALVLDKVKDKFDIVYSFGLIEHFSETEASKLIHNHFKICEENGHVIISVPNFNSIIYKIQYSIFMPFTLYGTHNFKIMKLKFLVDVMSKYGEIEYAGFVGGKYNPPGVKPFKYLFNLINKINVHKFKSLFYPSILVVAKKIEN